MVIKGVTLTVLLTAVVTLQLARERMNERAEPREAPSLLYIRSPEAARRLALSYSSLVADVYWIRALQHYGRSRLGSVGQPYELLFPLLDMTTTLDPLFNVAYRFGAIFLTEPPPGGPGRPDLAIELLEKGLQARPGRWELAQDIGFVHYRSGDYLAAADWFRRASEIPGSANWLPLLEAVTRARGGSRDTSRQLWLHILEQARGEEEWMRRQATLRLLQLDAMDQIDALSRVVSEYEAQAGRPPASWNELIARGHLAGIPVDPEGHPYRLNPWWGIVTLAEASPLNPLPTPEVPLP